jgi:hypothetical protein
MPNMLTSHPYFFANLPLFAVVCAILTRGRRGQLCRLALYSALACLPCSLLALKDGGYWRPARLGGGRIGVEDLVFTFTSGAAAWLCAAWLYRRDLSAPSHLPVSRAVRRLLLWGLTSDVLLAALWRAGLDPMSTALLAAIPLLTVLLIQRRRLWILACTGLTFFVPAYFSVVKLQFAIFPDYSLQWNQQGPWAAQFLGLPAGELAWSAAFAFFWPVVIASAFDVELRPASAAVAASGL